MNKKLVAITLAMGALVYASVVTEIFLGYPLSPTRSYLSELSAIDQASAPLVRTMDAVAGVLFAAAGFALWMDHRRETGGLAVNAPPAGGLTTEPPTGRWHSVHVGTLRIVPGRLIAVGLMFAGLATTLDAAFPMDCAESEPGCLERLAMCTSFSHQAHAVTSSLAGTGLVVVAIGAFFGSRLHQALSAIVVVGMVTQLLAIGTGLPVGIPQRVQIAASVLLMFVLAWDLWRKGEVHVGHSAGLGANTD
ncbi:DUF998 domain-containing protein [Trueperella pecoris]|uniref:DUF998 domain-containing protein n=1 Tax=Trueperella pecoris TaxID=2733571 RepID=A0A7M1R114_9ACTO|nr:DUF998 domain-containing protein [Trueperella pecoris]QOR47384.1 DUF998 domain-containing protein [Trueperella pecoris]